MTNIPPFQAFPSCGPSNGVSHGERPSLVREYFGSEPRKFLYLVCVLIGVIVLVTVPYAMLVGFDKWSSDMKEASRMMWASYTPAAETVPVLPAPAPGSYSVVPTAIGSPLAAQPSGGRQYVCPNCGATGLPAWNDAAQPRCPICGGMMSVGPLRTGEDWIAAPQVAPGQWAVRMTQ